MIKNNHILETIEKFKKKSKGSLGIFQRFEEGCPLRFRVNVYKGCFFKCKYCYINQVSKPNPDVIRHLSHDIELAKDLDLKCFPVMVSCSSDPFQPLESQFKYTQRVLNELAKNGFELIVMTQNPAPLLRDEYLNSLLQVPSVVEITIPSLNSGTKSESMFNTSAPPVEERFEKMKLLNEKGVSVRLRLDPIIPRFNENGPGQSEEEIWKIIKNSSEIGVEMVISNVMVLTPDINMFVWRQLGSYYVTNGRWMKNAPESRTNKLVLKSHIKETLLRPVYQACKEFFVPFCPCNSDITFNNSVTCLLRKQKENG